MPALAIICQRTGQFPASAAPMMRLTYLLLLPLTVAWPALHTAVFVARFDRLPEGGVSATFVFLPMGLVSALALIALLMLSTTSKQRIRTTQGYLLAAPIAFIGSLAGPLLAPPLVGATLFGALPLIGGTTLGFLGSRRPESSDLG